MSSPDTPPAPTPPQPLALGWVLWALVCAFAPGLAAWAWTRDDRAALLLDNQLPGGESSWQGLAWGCASALFVAALHLLVLRRATREGQPPGPALRRLGLLLAPLAATILLPLIHVPGIERGRQLLVIVLLALFAAAIGLATHTAWPWLREHEVTRRLNHSRLAPPLLLAALTVGQCAMMIHLGLVRHRGLGSRIFDLGIFDNLLFHAMQGHWQSTSVLKGGTFTSAHCAPILQLLAPIYAIAPGPTMLISIQAIWVASGVVPLYLLTQTLFSQWSGRRWLGLVFGVVWLCHPSLHGVVLFDFHALTLAAPLIVWAVYALAAERPRLWIAAIALLLITREDLPFVVCVLGLFALAEGRRRWALLTIAAALLTLAVVKLALMEHADLFMPDTESSYRYANRFSGVIPDPETGGAFDILATVAGNPGFLIQHALVIGKLAFLAMLALPMMATFVAARRALWPAAFGLVFLVLSSGANLANPYLHYTVFLFPPLIAASVYGLRNLVERVGSPEGRGRALVAAGVALCVCAPMAGDKFGALGHSRMFAAGVAPLQRKLDDEASERYAWLAAATAQIPDQASVAATNSLGPHVSTRDEIYNFRHRKQADWLLLATNELERGERAELRRRERSGELELVDSWRDEILVYRSR
ncbi:MAG: DUF2079 domain-containing protein [Myxococcales bacterium]|nr:DUF2079 domain-containing protein [Myxococcales bacterium]